MDNSTISLSEPKDVTAEEREAFQRDRAVKSFFFSFLTNIKYAGPDECWLWMGCRDVDGYGAQFIGGKKRGAHQIAYEIAKGPIPKGLQILHSCDNPPCVNPRHLTAGTHGQNHTEKALRGRTANVRGGRKLSAEQVAELRRRYATETQAALAKEFGISRAQINNIVGGLHNKRPGRPKKST